MQEHTRLRIVTEEVELAPEPAMVISAVDTGSGQPDGATNSEQIVPTSDTNKARKTSRAEYLISAIKQHKRAVAMGITALILVGAGTVFGLYRLISQRQAKPETRTQPGAPQQTMEMRKLTNTGNITTAAISPDGKYVAYAKLDGGQQSLWLRQVAITSNVQIAPPAESNFTGLTFSRDGNYLYYVKDSTLYQMPVLGGTTRKLIAPVARPVTFSPDGLQLAFATIQVRAKQRSSEPMPMAAENKNSPRASNLPISTLRA